MKFLLGWEPLLYSDGYLIATTTYLYGKVILPLTSHVPMW